MKIPVKIQRETELVSRTDLLFGRLQTVLFPKNRHHFLKTENIKIYNESSFLPGGEFLFLHFKEKQGIEILPMQIIQCEN